MLVKGDVRWIVDRPEEDERRAVGRAKTMMSVTQALSMRERRSPLVSGRARHCLQEFVHRAGLVPAIAVAMVVGWKIVISIGIAPLPDRAMWFAKSLVAERNAVVYCQIA